MTAAAGFGVTRPPPEWPNPEYWEGCAALAGQSRWLTGRDPERPWGPLHIFVYCDGWARL